MDTLLWNRLTHPTSLLRSVAGLILTFSILMVSVSFRSVSAVTSVDSFVQRSGTQFVVNGSPFYVTGANTHYLAWGTDAEIDNLLDDAVAMNFNVLRTFISVVRGSPDGRVPTIWQADRVDDSSNLDVNGVYFLYWDAGRMAWNDGADGLERIDRLIAKAKQRNIRLLFSLLDFYDYTGGSQQMSAWYGSTDRYTFFFADERTRSDYKAWVRHVLERMNTITGIAYKDDPTIFGWDLMNEPQFSSVKLATDWITEMSVYVKSIDSRHLLGTGAEGFFGGKSGNEPLSQLMINTIDFGTWHTYPVYHKVSPQDVVGLIQAHCDVARRASKPVLMEEFGYGARNSDQAAVYKKWLDAVRDDPNCAGWLVWRLTARMKNGSYPRDQQERFDIHSDNGRTAQVFRAAAYAGRNPTADSTQPPAVAVIPTTAPTLSPQSRFVMGVDLNGSPLHIDGDLWRGYQAALESGLTVRGAAIDTKTLPKLPEAPSTTAQMLDTLIYSEQELGTLTLTQELVNGKYFVFIWVMENFQANSRSFDLALQGKLTASGLGDLPMNMWVKYGPFPAHINDGLLRLDLQPRRGRALLMGLAIYTDPT